ncbi:unnamed protein product [Moneuplotes crassus]|uniref:Uncharacterized protein n=1 Tax=Euplotes crassus TaxID=5936 RepID=A0AAD1UEJ5_EUPCR|nr:unnamed protein product [Moneuplotes crassus]
MEEMKQKLEEITAQNQEIDKENEQILERRTKLMKQISGLDGAGDLSWAGAGSVKKRILDKEEIVKDLSNELYVKKKQNETLLKTVNELKTKLKNLEDIENRHTELQEETQNFT